jgi:hypothetical protein
MSHPDPHAPLDRTPIQIGEVWENPMTGERVHLVDRLQGLSGADQPLKVPSDANYLRLSVVKC